jgi:serine/threonine protein kinase
MERAAVPASSPKELPYVDGLGERRHVVDPAGADALELLCVRSELAAVPSFEFALRERVSRLTTFRHACYGRVRSVERLTDGDATLAVVSERTEGVRLSDLLLHAEQRRLSLDINTALCLIRQLVPAVSMLHEHAGDSGIAHGAIGPERVIVTPNGRLVIAEYVLGAALEQLRFSQERYWTELRVALPRAAGLPRFDHHADVTQIGVVSLSLILGRLLRDDEYPARVGEVLASTWAVSARGGFEPLPPGLRGWLGRALHLDARTAFRSAIEARDELDKVLGDTDFLASPTSLEAFLARYSRSATDAPATPGPQAPRSEAARPVTMPPPAAPPVMRAAHPPIVKPPVASPPGFDPPAVNPAVVNSPRATASPTQAPSATRPPTAAPVAATSTHGDPRPFDAPRAPSPAAPAAPAPPARAPKAPTPGPAPRDLADQLQPFAAPVQPAAHGLEASALPGQTGVRTPQMASPYELNPFAVPEKPRRRWTALGVAAAAALAVVAGGGYAARDYLAQPQTTLATSGTLVVNTTPPGVDAFVDGLSRGKTPLTLSLPAGAHTLELRGPGEPRSIPITITAGSQVSQFVELAAAPGAAFGQLQVRTEPPGAHVTIDETPRGISPVVVTDLTPGEHTVVLESDLGIVKQMVTIESGVTSSLVVPLATARAPVSGWVSVSAPVEMELYEQGRLIGTTQSERVMVSAGRHEIEIVNQTLGYRATRVVQVPAGRVASLSVEMPMGTIALNAVPWAEVWIDGQRVGETPIGNLPVPIGPHEIVFRNPQLGERRHAATVTLNGPTRVSVDLRKQ